MNSTPKFVVRLNNGIAIKFRPINAFSVTDQEATVFDYRADATLTALEYRMRPGTFQVEPLPLPAKAAR